jgi:type II secretory pathway pseudopilin PulG
MTLLETLLALSLMSVISVLAAQVVRTSWQAWDIQDHRSDTLQHLSGALAHVTRQLRTCRNVVEVSDPSNASGYLAIMLPDDSVVKWAHDNANQVVRYGGDPPTELLATGIDSLKFECFEIDGVTPTTVPADIRMIRTTASVTIPVQGTPFALSSTVWIRKQQDGLAAEFIDFYAANSSTPIGWQNHGYLIGPADGLLSSGPQGATVRAFGFDPAEHTGAVGTVLVGLCLKTDGPIGDDVLDVQINRGSLGPMHSFHEPALLRFKNNLDWFWVDVTDDFTGWTYEDLAGTYVLVTNRDAGTGGATIYLDSVKIRTFEAAPLSQTFWLTGVGTAFNEWGNRSGAVGPPDGTRAYSQIFSVAEGDIDRQDYSYTGSWEDLGTIVRVRLLIADFYMTATVVDDEFHARLPLTTGPSESQDTPAPNTAEEVPIDVLNQHVGSANPGTVSLDFSNLENWTWTGVRSRFVRLYMSAIGVPEADIYVDGVALVVRYVPPDEAAVVLWEEL